jgi:hypothetical protein
MPTATAIKIQPAPSDFEAARARWLPAKAKLVAMQRHLKALRTAAAFDRASDFDRKSDRLANMRSDIAAAFPEGAPRSRLLPGLIEKAENEIEDYQAIFANERDLWTMAVRDESARIGERLQPKHLAAVQEIATALENLTKAIATADEVRAEFACTAPEPTSALLPDVAGDLRHCRLDVWDSAAAAWARRMRDLGVLP